MRRFLVVPLLALGLLSAAFAPPAVRAAGRADFAVGVWVQRIRPRDDMAGARAVVTATHARPAREVLWGDGEGMSYAEFRFTAGATSTLVTITPVVPNGMRLVSGGCDRKRFNGAETGMQPYDVPARNGHVVMTLGNRQSASCIFTVAPGSAPDTSTAISALPARQAAGPARPGSAPIGLALGAALVAVLAICFRRRSSAPY